MRLSTVACYLIGDRTAILALGQDRGMPLVGAALVFSVGLARAYHTVDLLAKPWHLLLPFAVSIVMASVLLLTTRIGPRAGGGKQLRATEFFHGRFLPFLGLFWMTAPLAWLYGIPYERFSDPLTATKAKVWTLAAVSVWRVVLMARVLAVLSGRRFIATFFQVMLVADGVVWATLALVKFPLIQFMAQIRLTNAEKYLADTVLLTQILSFLSLPVWILGAAIAFFQSRTWKLGLPQASTGSKGVWVVTGAAMLLGIAGLFWTQPEQRLATRAETLLRSGQIEEGLKFMSAHPRSDFPPLWEPPPRVGYGEQTPPLLDVLQTLAKTPAADWVRQAYLAGFARRFLQGEDRWPEPQDWQRAAQVLDELPEGKSVREQYHKEIESNEHYVSQRKDSDAQRAREQAAAAKSSAASSGNSK